ncbi:hypothetical protein D3C84_307630 [compost metagenome]
MLALASGQILATLADLQLVALGVQAGEFVHAGQLGGLQHLLVLHVACAGHQVVAQGAGEQLDVLGHIADVVAQVADVQLAHIDAVEQQAATVGLVQADDQPGQRTLARAAAADDADLLAGADAQGDVREGRLLLLRVVEVDVAELDGALQSLALERTFVRVALLGEAHQLVDRVQGHLGLLIAQYQAGKLGQRRQGTTAEHVAGDQAAHAELAGDDQVDAGDDGGHPGQLLQEHRRIEPQTGEHARAQFQAGEGADGLLPQVLALALGIVGLDGIEAAEGLDQARLALGSQCHAALHDLSQGSLQRPADQRRQRKGQQRNPYQLPADQRDRGEDQQDEGQVDQAGQRERSEEVAQALEFVNALREAADPRRAELHGHAGDTLEQRGGNDQVGLLAGQIQAQAAQGLEQQVEQKGAGHAERQHPQGRGRLVGHHAVVDIHHEQRDDQADQVDHQAGGHGIDIQPARALEGIAEPGSCARDQLALAEFEPVLRLGEECLAAVVLGEQLGADAHFAALALAEHDPRLALFVPAEQQGAAAVTQQQQGRQGNGRDLLQRSAQPASLQPAAGRGTRQQLGGQTLLGQRQAAGEHGPAGRLLVQDAQRQ